MALATSLWLTPGVGRTLQPYVDAEKNKFDNGDSLSNKQSHLKTNEIKKSVVSGCANCLLKEECFESIKNLKCDSYRPGLGTKW